MHCGSMVAYLAAPTFTPPPLPSLTTHLSHSLSALQPKPETSPAITAAISHSAIPSIPIAQPTAASKPRAAQPLPTQVHQK